MKYYTAISVEKVDFFSNFSPKNRFLKPILLSIFCLSLLFLTSEKTTAQNALIKKFSTTPAKFIHEVDSLIAPFRLPEENFNGAEWMTQLKMDWENGIYSPEEQSKMCEIVNKMVDKRFQIRTYVAYFRTSQQIKHRPQDPNGWENWHRGLSYIADNEKHTVLSDYLLASETLLLRQVFSSFRKVEWMVADSNYLLRFDTIPYVEFPNATTIAVAYNNDTVKIHQTRGVYYPLEHLLKGEGGKFFWDRQQIAHDKIWAELSDYTLETLVQEVRFDNVRFFHRDYFAQPITGTITDKAYSNAPQTPLPTFTSAQTNLSIQPLYDHFSYHGGFRMAGSNIYGYGTLQQPAELQSTVNQHNSIALKSLEFALSPQYMTAEKVAFTIRCEEDSLYHPEMMMTYNHPAREISLTKGKSAMGGMSIIDSYHKVDIDSDGLCWKLDSGEINFSTGNGLKKKSAATFRSHNFFRAGNYRQLKGLDKENPLDILIRLSAHYQRDSISYYEIAYDQKITETQARLLMSELASHNFLFLDYANEGVIIRDIAKLYPLAYMRKIDYDNLVFRSEESKINAKLLLDSMDMYIFNIDRIWLSDTQEVGVLTYVNDIVLQKNRNFSFNGFVGAGLFDFFTDSLISSIFNYEEFSITMPIISSLEFWVNANSSDANSGRKRQMPVTSFIENISGKLYIDEPNNKSGIKKFDQYSYFVAGVTDQSAIYYNKAYAPEKYPKDRFKFKVHPFIINNLQTTSIENMKVPGVLQSSGIIPDFETVATLRPDFSLGFNMVSDNEGFPMYDNQGVLKGTLDLSNHGLYADGTLHYLSSTSTTDADDIWDQHSFVFFPDSSIATLQSFDIQEVRTGVEFPMVHGAEIAQTWYPNQSLMQVKNSDQPFSIFKEHLQFSGKLNLTPSGLKGFGGIQLTQMSIISSNEFDFKSTSFSSKNADVTILSKDLSKPVLNAYKYGFTMDLETRKGDFLLRNDSSYVRFPENEFTATGYHFSLNMDSLTFNFYAPEETNQYAQLKNLSFKELINKYDQQLIHGPQVSSTNIKHEDFRFIANKARLSIFDDHQQLNFSEIPLIKIADSYIIPHDGAFSVNDHPDTIFMPQSQLTMKNDTISHYLHDADLQVLDQHRYQSRKAIYDYVSITDTIPVLMHDIHIDKETQMTVAQGFIHDSAQFKPHPAFEYYGDVKVSCESPFMHFFGYLKLPDDACDTLPAAWIAIDTLIDPKAPLIPIATKTFDDENKVTFVGLAHGYDGRFYRFYNSLFKRIKNNRNDDTIFTVNGLLVYDELFGEYRIGQKSVLDNPTEPDNLLIYNPISCQTIGNGVLNLNPKFAQKNVDIQAFGTYTYDHNADSLWFEATTEIALPMNKKIMEKITTLLYNSRHPDGENFLQPFMKKYFNHRLGKERSEELRSNFSNSKYTLPKEFQHRIVFSKIPLRWQQGTYSYYFSGTAELTLAHDKIIDKKIPLTIRYSKHRPGNRDMLQIYFEADDNNRFYILLSERGKSFFWTSNPEIESLIKGKIKDDKEKENESQKELIFEWIDESAAEKFIFSVEDME